MTYFFAKKCLKIQVTRFLVNFWLIPLFCWVSKNHSVLSDVNQKVKTATDLPVSKRSAGDYDHIFIDLGVRCIRFPSLMKDVHRTVGFCHHRVMWYPIDKTTHYQGYQEQCKNLDVRWNQFQNDWKQRKAVFVVTWWENVLISVLGLLLQAIQI